MKTWVKENDHNHNYAGYRGTDTAMLAMAQAYIEGFGKQLGYYDHYNHGTNMRL